MSKAGTTQPQAAFTTALRRALERLADPEWLAAQSPLATPTFLGAAAPTTTRPDDPALGRALRDLLFETADSFWEGGPPPTRAALESAVDEARLAQGNAGDEYAYLVLELRYFRRYFGPDAYPVESADIPVFLAVSNTRFFVHLQQAIDRLGEALLRRVQPALRLERPPVPATFVGRAGEQRELTAALAAGQGVSLSGPPGAGKTTLGAVIARDWPDGRVFWYTFLPGLNDTLGALLFALAHFTRERGGAALWAYLAAHGGEFDPAQAAGLLRADLAALGDPAPLLVLDEVDLLRTADGEPRLAGHSQLLFLIESLVDTPLLLIGQRSYVDTPVHLSLPALDEDGVVALLDAAGAHLPRSQARRVHEVTGGLPRLVWLVIALLRSGEDADEMTRLPLRGDATPLFHRLWRRLDADEKQMLVALSVFRRAAPGDLWPSLQSAVGSLQERRLLARNERGEMALQPFFQRLVYQELRPEQREQFHLQAGAIRAERGDATAAAYHFAQANEPELAVAVWFPQRDLEVSRGQAGAALEVFGGLSGKGLPKAALRQLKVIQNQLYLLAGETAQVVENVRGITWEMDDALTAEAYIQSARASSALGRPDAALETFAQALAVLGRQVDTIVETHYRRGLIYSDEAELAEARNEALRAGQRLAMFRGWIEVAANRYEAAEEAFRAGLELATQLDDAALIAQSRRRLAETASMTGRVDEAEQYLGEAIAYYEKLGDKLTAEWLRVTLGNAYLNARRFDEAIPPTERALAFLEQTGQTQWTAQPLGQLAEAYLETGQPEKAIAYAYRVLNLEVPLFRPYAFYTLGLAQQRLARPDVAGQAFAEGLATARHNGDRFIEAYLLRSLGRLRAAQGEGEAAREALSAAAELFRAMGLAHEVAETEGELGTDDGRR